MDEVIAGQVWVNRKKPSRVVEVTDVSRDNVVFRRESGEGVNLAREIFTAMYKPGPTMLNEAVENAKRIDPSFDCVVVADRFSEIGHERLTVLKSKISCPCGDVHEIKEAGWEAFCESVQQFTARHAKCLTTNVLPFGEDRIDPKQKPVNGEVEA